MIALNKNLPIKCFDCPCFQTLTIPDVDKDLTHWIRFCAAAGKIIFKCAPQPEDDISMQIPTEWMCFKKPEWCPWIEII